MVTMLAGLAEFERELIHARTVRGQEAGAGAGVKMGRRRSSRRTSSARR